MKTISTLLTLLSISLFARAHFQLTYPASRGSNEQTQSTSPCGGLDVPSTTRTPWGVTGGQLKFEAGHDEADTAVYLALGNNPARDDFSIILADKFKQVGLGTFCWSELRVPDGTQGVRDGVNATIQVVQAGHTGGGLYNCADITFVSSPPEGVSACANASGVSAEPASQGDGDGHGDPGSNASASSSSSSATPSGTGKPNGGSVNAVTGIVLVGAGVMAVVGGWVL
ncbi:hypothetical protein C7212DRAFT_183252 [Tuber magnatum]|uniref:Copper acquisition factor BIM1-like domain-containing protein n=1 Tax=Tuber magnatum TaxID=42249 RepID=A0A317SVH5_9PEZI|nr:hypothetical protein C7212DRAFT_183252 [Tuber magnatum]